MIITKRLIEVLVLIGEMADLVLFAVGCVSPLGFVIGFPLYAAMPSMYLAGSEEGCQSEGGTEVK